MTREGFIITVQCPDRIGIVSAVAGFLAERGCNIVESQQFEDQRSARFFLRIHAIPPVGTSLDDVRAQFAPLAAGYDMTWRLLDATARVRTIIMVSHTDHCLDELLDLWEKDYLAIDIAAIVSNHEALRPAADAAGVPFHHIPVTASSKPDAERRLLKLIDETGTELVVLARYMQILSDDLCLALEGRAINIHHSFLPGFKGARPYHQAYERGVKFIGATAHYVTADLDEGPIIEQSVLRVDHRAAPEDLTFAGRQAERTALALAVRWHAEHRILVHGGRTVVFT